MHETTETEYAISEITNPQSYCGDDNSVIRVVSSKEFQSRSIVGFKPLCHSEWRVSIPREVGLTVHRVSDFLGRARA